MKTWDIVRCALTSCATAALLAGCGGSQPPIGAPGAERQPSANATHEATGRSWMLPGASSGDLIYAVHGCSGTCVISYPSLTLVGTVATSGSAICSDTSGNVFIPEDSQVTEYAHGGTTPIATLGLPGYLAAGCAVDPTTNNLAVVFKGSDADIAIFANEQGTPTLYASHIGSEYCGYDNSGNLFVDGSVQEAQFAELPKGASDFTVLSISYSVGVPGQVQWDGKYITYEGRGSPEATIYRLAISGSAATIVGTTTLKSIKYRASQSWLYGSKVIAPYYDQGSRFNIVGVWDYPQGGKVRKTIKHFHSRRTGTDFQGATLSVGSKR